MPKRERPTILIVDDKQEIRTWLREVLHHYRVIELHNGEQAVKTAVEQRPDLIITDLLMPKLDGFGVCRAIRAHPQTAYIPVFVMTGVEDPNITLTALDAGADHILSKPLSLPELMLRVRNAVQRKVLIDELVRAGGGGAKDAVAEERGSV